MKRCVMIINPTAGSYSPRMVEEARGSVQAAGYAVEVLLTRSEADAAEFAAAEAAGADMIVAGGGDGTVNGVLNGLAGAPCAMGVLPLGTSNVLARELGIRNIADAVSRICRGRTR
ncbi:MAG TPA: acylglycerol kinase family protein, partial [Verrucomicrobiae bacterium]|nr:acylglycerol kinase family protein [Verrucomicrobiae bacterium]